MHDQEVKIYESNLQIITDLFSEVFLDLVCFAHFYCRIDAKKEDVSLTSVKGGIKPFKTITATQQPHDQSHLSGSKKKKLELKLLAFTVGALPMFCVD
jgi:hypothetical protein